MRTPEIEKFCTVRNANYDRVLAVMGRYVSESRVSGCTCEKCINAIVASALNCLPPHYYADGDAEQEAGSPWVMVESAVCESIERVRAHPCHQSGRVSSD